jgi:hypothetical protein
MKPEVLIAVKNLWQGNFTGIFVTLLPSDTVQMNALYL